MRHGVAVGLVVALVVALLRCGPDECMAASDRYTSCVAMASSSSSAGGIPTEVCAGPLLCKARCVNDHSCAQINAYDPAFTSCWSACDAQ